MLLTTRANCARHVNGEAGYLNPMEVLSSKVTKRGLVPQDEERCSRVWYPARKETVLDDADVGNEDRKKPRQEARRGE